MTGEHCEEVLRVTTCTFLQHPITHMTPIQTHHSASWYQPEHEAGGGIGRYRKASEQVPGNIVILESHWNLGSNRTQNTWKQPFYRAQHLSNTPFILYRGTDIQSGSRARLLSSISTAQTSLKWHQPLHPTTKSKSGEEGDKKKKKIIRWCCPIYIFLYRIP